jgi:hypothetical protein
MVLLKPLAHGLHIDVLRNNISPGCELMGEALLIPVSVVERLKGLVADDGETRRAHNSLAALTHHLEARIKALEGLLPMVASDEAEDKALYGIGKVATGWEEGMRDDQQVGCYNCGAQTTWGEAVNWRRVWQGEPGPNSFNYFFCPNCPDAEAPVARWEALDLGRCVVVGCQEAAVGVDDGVGRCEAHRQQYIHQRMMQAAIRCEICGYQPGAGKQHHRTCPNAGTLWSTPRIDEAMEAAGWNPDLPEECRKDLEARGVNPADFVVVKAEDNPDVQWINENRGKPGFVESSSEYLAEAEEGLEWRCYVPQTTDRAEARRMISAQMQECGDVLMRKWEGENGLQRESGAGE